MHLMDVRMLNNQVMVRVGRRGRVDLDIMMAQRKRLRLSAARWTAPPAHENDQVFVDQGTTMSSK